MESKPNPSKDKSIDSIDFTSPPPQASSTPEKKSENSLSVRNTSELVSCIVGVPREAEIEVSNRSDRRMTCSLMLRKIQASEECIKLDLPGDTLLVEPGRDKLIKVGVEARQMRPPILAIIHVAVYDMVTRSSEVMEHLMGFVPEEPQIGLTTSLRRDNADLQILPERCGKAFPVTLENKNNTELPVKIMISKHPEQPQAFRITGFANAHINVVNQRDKDIDYNLKLEPHQKFPIEIHFVGTSLAALNIRKGANNAKLVIQLRTDGTEGLVLEEISLGVGDCSHLRDQVPMHNLQPCTTPQSWQMSSPDLPRSPASNRTPTDGNEREASESNFTVFPRVVELAPRFGTQVFYSLCSNNSSTSTSGYDSHTTSDTPTDGNEREASESNFTVFPRVVVLAPPSSTEATITVTSLCDIVQPFETSLSHKDCLSVVPTEGMIPAGGSFPLKLQCHKEMTRSLSATLKILVENQEREVWITVSKE